MFTRISTFRKCQDMFWVYADKINPGTQSML